MFRLSVLYFIYVIVMTETINLLQPIMLPLIFPFRCYIRKYVYSYSKTHDMFLYGANYENHEVIKTHKYIYYIMLFFWYFLDDANSNDIYDFDTYKKLLNKHNKLTKHIVKNKLLNDKHNGYLKDGAKVCIKHNVSYLTLLLGNINTNSNNFYLKYGHILETTGQYHGGEYIVKLGKYKLGYFKIIDNIYRSPVYEIDIR